VRIRARRWLTGIFVFCVGAQVLFFTLDYHVNYGRLADIGAIRRLFNTAREDGLASWFAVVQTALLALTVWALFVCARAAGATRWRQVGWLVLALFFTYMSADDGATIHERLGTTFRESNPDSATIASYPSYAWQLAVLPFFVAMGLFMVVFLGRELTRPRGRALVVLALFCFVIAIGLDFGEGLGEEHALNPYNYLVEHTGADEWARKRFHRTGYDALRHFQKSLEECIEMFGMTLLWIALLGELLHVAPEVRLVISSDRPEPFASDGA